MLTDAEYPIASYECNGSFEYENSEKQSFRLK